MKRKRFWDQEMKTCLPNYDQSSTPSSLELVSPAISKTIFLDQPLNNHFRMQIVLATNQVNQLDSAVLDRMNELLEIPLPEFPEREAMLKQYILRG